MKEQAVTASDGTERVHPDVAGAPYVAGDRRTSASVAGENLVEVIERMVRDKGGAEAPSVQVRSSADAFGDIAIFIGRDLDAANLMKLTQNLAASPSIEVAKRSGRRITLRLADEAIAELGRHLEAGVPRGLETYALLRGKRYYVDYGDPNATKALHVGHLRCIALGHAITSILKSAGASVTTLSLVNDIGRSICEAMAGYLEYFPRETPESAGMKPDHFVGRCYSAYVKSLTSPDAHEGTLNAPIGRELDERSDLAQTLLARWTAGDPEVRDVWAKVRRWVLDGQDATVARLGALQDRMLYESVSLGRAAKMIEAGLENGVFRRTDTGTIVYETGLSEYQYMPLVRNDGFPTENLRLAAIFYDIQEEGRGLDGCLHIMGDEWVQLIACRERMLPRFIECPLYSSYYKLGCAMVTFHGSKMKSSSGEALLIDELVDQVAALDDVVRLAGDEVTGPTPEQLARIIILGFYLARKTSKTIEFSWELFTDPGRNVGWQLAAAWSRACRQGAGGPPDPDPKDPAYRYAILRSQCFRQSVGQSAEERDVIHTMNFLGHLASWYLGNQSAVRTDRVMRTVLRVGLTSVGLLDPSP